MKERTGINMQDDRTLGDNIPYIMRSVNLETMCELSCYTKYQKMTG